MFVVFAWNEAPLSLSSRICCRRDSTEFIYWNIVRLTHCFFCQNGAKRKITGTNDKNVLLLSWSNDCSDTTLHYDHFIFTLANKQILYQRPDGKGKKEWSKQQQQNENKYMELEARTHTHSSSCNLQKCNAPTVNGKECLMLFYSEWELYVHCVHCSLSFFFYKKT